MEEIYSLYYDDHCVAEGYIEKEFTELLKDFQLDCNWKQEDKYECFLTNHYWYMKELPF